MLERALRGEGGPTLEGWYETALPRLSLRYFLRAKATHPTKRRMATQQRADFNYATAQCYLHDVFPPCCVFPILPLGLLFFPPRAQLLTPFLSLPAYRSYITVDNRTPEPMPFPRLRTPSRAFFPRPTFFPPPSLSPRKSSVNVCSCI